MMSWAVIINLQVLMTISLQNPNLIWHYPSNVACEWFLSFAASSPEVTKGG